MEWVDLERGFIGHVPDQRTRSQDRRSAPGLSWSPTVKGSGYKELFNHSKRHTSLNMDGFITDRTSVLDTVCFRLDTQAWLAWLPEFQRELALEMAQGDGILELAQRHHISPARVSQRRTELKTSYEKFLL